MAAAMAGCSQSGKTTQFESKTPKEEPVDSIEMFIEYLDELAAKRFQSTTNTPSIRLNIKSTTFAHGY